MFFENKNSEVLLALQKRGHSEQEIALMSPKKAFAEYCEWNGLLSWGETLWNQVMILSGNAEVPTLEPVFPDEHGEPKLCARSRARLVSAIVRAYNGSIDLENLLRCGHASIEEMGDRALMALAARDVPIDDLQVLTDAVPELRLRRTVVTAAAPR